MNLCNVESYEARVARESATFHDFLKDWPEARSCWSAYVENLEQVCIWRGIFRSDEPDHDIALSIELLDNALWALRRLYYAHSDYRREKKLEAKAKEDQEKMLRLVEINNGLVDQIEALTGKKPDVEALLSEATEKR